MNQLFKSNSSASSLHICKTDLSLDLTQLRDVVWQPVNQFHLNQIELDWLTDSDSLTRKLQKIAAGFHVMLLTDGWQLPSVENHVGSDANRQVLLCDAQLPLVLGLTEVNQRALKQESALCNWFEKPLGELLFPENRARSRVFEIADFTQSSYLMDWLAKWYTNEVPAQLWGRRCEIAYHSAVLRLTEIFLPNHPLYGVSL